MTTAALEKAPLFALQDDAIDQLRAEYMQLEVTDVSDKQQVATVRRARLHVRELRIRVEKTRKELGEEALRHTQAVNAEANRIKALLEPMESHLQAEEDKPRIEAERIAREKEEQRQAVLAYRHRSLAEVGDVRPQQDYESLTDAEFDAMLDGARKAKEERDAEFAREAEERRIEAERLKAEREELDRQRREQEAEQARLAAEKAKLEAEAAEQRRKVELEKARQEAAEKAAREERERIERETAEEKAREEREAAEAKAKAEREEAERLRREANKPDHMKLVAFAQQIRNLELPSLSSLNKQAEADVAKAMGDLEAAICGIAQRIEA